MNYFVNLHRELSIRPDFARTQGQPCCSLQLTKYTTKYIYMQRSQFFVIHYNIRAHFL